MALHVRQFPCLSDNIGYLVHDGETGATAAIDAPDAKAIIADLQEAGWSLTDIFITHHHADHVGGIKELKKYAPQARVVGPRKEAAKIPMIETQVGEGDFQKLGGHEAAIIETPGHTAGHIVYYFEDEGLLFTGDTLFSLGCGRVFETPMGVMYQSLMKLILLPEETRIYCGHEYTLANAKFALRVEPDNAILVEHAKKVEDLRAKNQSTIPSTLALECAANPFLRAEIPAVQKAAGLPFADPAIIFAQLREQKNRS